MAAMAYVPQTSEKVLITGRHDVFLVLSVDQEKQTADVMQLNNILCVLDSVPLLALRPFRKGFLQDWPAN